MGIKSTDPLGGHVRIYWSLLDSHAFIALSTSARALYLDLRRKLGATNNGNIECTLATLRHRGWTAPNTLFNALQEIVTVGLLARTRHGGIAKGKKYPSLFRFTDLEVYEHPKLGVPKCKPTHDYRRFETLAHARATIKEMREEKRLKAEAKKKAKLQKLYRHQYRNDSEGPGSRYKNDTRAPRT